MRTDITPNRMHQASRHHVKSTSLLLALLLPFTLFAQVPSTATMREIEQLFTALESSHCEFNRNGSWHDAKKASAHLRRKYDYLLKRDLVGSTETFIERAASQSSFSGKPYTVRCEGHAPIPSKSWFLQKLASLRQDHQQTP